MTYEMNYYASRDGVLVQLLYAWDLIILKYWIKLLDDVKPLGEIFRHAGEVPVRFNQ